MHAALARVRFERYDLETFTGNTAYRRYLGRKRVRGMPSFAGAVGDATQLELPGLPSKEELVEFIDKLAALGGSEADVVHAVEASPGDATQLARAARWYLVHARRADALGYYTKLAGSAGAAAELRAEGDWYRLLLTPRDVPRGSRAALELARRNPGTTYGNGALAVVVAADEVDAAGEVAGVLAAWRDAARGDVVKTLVVVYYALALKQYDLALATAEDAVRLRGDDRSYDALAEVHHHRHERDLAVQTGEHAVSLAPDRAELRDDLERFRRDDDAPSPIVANIRELGYRWLPEFYGNGQDARPTGLLR